jgi:hypothetical protein
MSSVSVTEIEHGSDGGERGAPTSAYDLLALAEAIDGVEALLACRRPSCSATARDELWAASEIVGWVLELLPEVSGRDGSDATDLLELQRALSRGQAALTAAARHGHEPWQWHDVLTWLARTRRLLTVAAATLMP